MTDSNVQHDISNRIELLYQLSAKLAMSLDLQTTLEQVISLAVKFLHTERGSLVILDQDKRPIDAVLFYQGRTIFNNAAQFVDVVKRGLIAWVLENKEPAFINNTLDDPRWLKRADDHLDKTGAKSAMCIPLEAHGELVGVLTIVHPAPNHFNLDQFEFLKSVSDQSAMAVYNALLFDLQEARHRQYFDLFNDSITAIVITNLMGKILQANQSATKLIQRGEVGVIGTSMFELHQAPLELLGDRFNQLFGGNTLVYESTLTIKDENPLPIRVSVRMLPNDLDGRIQWLVEDISPEKELEALRSDMTSMVYHDIRSPLANVISSLELLKMMLPKHEDKNIDEVLTVISRSTNRVQRLVSNLLDIDRLEDEQHYIDMAEIDVRDLLTSVVTDVQPTMDSRKQVFQFHIDDTVQDVWADEDMLKRVMINLLENATKYSPMEEKIVCRINRLESNALRFIVEDNGPGIPKDQLENIFKKFTRISNRKGPKGIGLGLAFCKLAVDAHGGKIWAESDVSIGTRFIFELPNHPPQS